MQFSHSFLGFLFGCLFFNIATLTSQVSFTKNALTGINDRAEDICAADFTGDGLKDIFAGIFTSGQLTMWVNDGSGGFFPQVIATGFTSARAVAAGDLDNDGDIDMIAATEVAGPSDKLAWFSNNGSGIFTQFDFPLSNDSYYSIHVTDLDNDNHTDFLTTGLNGAISWWKNDGNATFIKSTIAGVFGDTRYVTTADLDGDMKLDVLAASGTGNELAWWKIDGTGLWSKKSIATGFNVASSIHAADVDGDNDLDVLGAAFLGDEIAWWENDGNGNFLIKHALATAFDGANDVKTADLDRDGDLDIIATAYNAFDLAWWRNDGNSAFTKIPIDENTRNPRRLNVADLNNDGDVDLLTAGTQSSSNGVVWWRNNLCSALIIQNSFQSICANEFYIFGSDTLLTEGDYSAVFTTASGCDSLVYLTLYVSNPDTAVVLIDETLVATSLLGSFQWINCLDNQPIIGAVSNVFTPTTSGDYAVLVEENGCLALSACFTVNICSVPIETNIFASICAGDSYLFGNQMLTDSGDYSQVFVASDGCDSILNLNLSVINIETTVEVSGATLSAVSQNGVQYQWIDCQTNQPIVGATLSIFTPTLTGNYAVFLQDNNGCSAFSDCHLVMVSSTDDTNIGSTPRIWPNPAHKGIVEVQSIEDMHDLSVTLWNSTGQQFKLLVISPYRFDVSRISPGFYMVEIESDGIRYFKKLIVD